MRSYAQEKVVSGLDPVVTAPYKGEAHDQASATVLGGEAGL